MDTFLPVDRLTENEHWVAFHHPQPDYALHILILPKSGLATMEEAINEPHEFFSGLFQVVNKLVLEFQLNECGYRLITNGGLNQSIPQWHWHLVSDLPGEKHA